MSAPTSLPEEAAVGVPVTIAEAEESPIKFLALTLTLYDTLAVSELITILVLVVTISV